MSEEGTRRAQVAPRRVCVRPPLRPVENVTRRRTRPDRAGSSLREPTHPDHFCTRSTFSPDCQHQNVRTDSVALAGSAPAPDVRLWERIRCALRRGKANVLTSREVARPARRCFARGVVGTRRCRPARAARSCNFRCDSCDSARIARRRVRRSPPQGGRAPFSPAPDRTVRPRRAQAFGAKVLPRRRSVDAGAAARRRVASAPASAASPVSPLRELDARRAMRALSRGRAGGRPPIRSSRIPRGAVPLARPRRPAPGSAARSAPPAHDGTLRRNARPRRLRPATA